VLLQDKLFDFPLVEHGILIGIETASAFGNCDVWIRSDTEPRMLNVRVGSMIGIR